MATSLLALLDDIASVLDDVTAMTKIAASRTAGLLGDDLALNAEQVSGVRAERELPVVWAVFKGSARNKLILVPGALILAVVAPFMIQPILMVGGCYLCFEGFEKISEKFLHPEEKKAEMQQFMDALHNPETDLVEFEQKKIKGAIRTDFVLSAEIIIIALGTVQESSYITQVFTLIAIAIIMTIGVYGLVAAIVKLDDAGMHLVKIGGEKGFRRWFGERILAFAPYLMKGLTIVGTAAMFLVGGGILAHGIPGVESVLETIIRPASEVTTIGPGLGIFASLLVNGILGVIAGGLLIPLLAGFQKLISLVKPENKMTGE